MAYEKPRITNVRGRTISIAHLDIPTEPHSFLAGSINSGGTALTVLDNAGFAQNQLVLIGQLGYDQAEIKRVSAAVSAGTPLTVTALTFYHETGDEIRRMLFDQWKIYGNSSNTTVGATLIATINIQVDAPQTQYVNTGTEYAYYFVRPYDSYNSVDGDTYSDGVNNTTGYDPRSAGFLIEQALITTKMKKGGDITDEWLINELNDGATYVSNKLKRFSFLENFNYVLGQTSRGIYTFSLPTDIQEKNSNKSILNVRIGANSPLRYMDKREFVTMKQDVVSTISRVVANPTDTTLQVENSYDFDDSGSIKVFVNNTSYSITYTGVTRSATAGVLTGIPATGDGSISVIIPVGTNVFQRETEGRPFYFTVYDNILEIFPLPDSYYDNLNVFIDYFTERTRITSAGDILESSRYDLYKHWLIWKLRSRNSSTGELNLQDADKLLFDGMLTDMIIREVSGQKYRMRPKVNGIVYGGETSNRAGSWIGK